MILGIVRVYFPHVILGLIGMFAGFIALFG